MTLLLLAVIDVAFTRYITPYKFYICNYIYRECNAMVVYSSGGPYAMYNDTLIYVVFIIVLDLRCQPFCFDTCNPGVGRLTQQSRELHANVLALYSLSLLVQEVR